MSDSLKTSFLDDISGIGKIKKMSKVLWQPSDKQINKSNLARIIYSLLGKKYIIEGTSNNKYFLRRATNKTRSLLSEIFKIKTIKSPSLINFKNNFYIAEIMEKKEHLLNSNNNE